jgi:14-3-3 protein epsilon
VAYKNWIGSRRTAWRAIAGVIQKEESKGSKYLDLLRKYQTKIENEVENICNDIGELLDKSLVPKAKEAEPEVFYLKMKGDYFRYFAECASEEKKKKAGEVAHDCYKKAQEKASALPTTHPIRLGLALNYSVFLYEIINSPEQACTLAKTTFDSAIGDLEHLEDEQYKESASIMQLLKDNLTLWTTEAQEEAPEKKKEDVQDL